MKKLVLASLLIAANSVAFASSTVVITFTALPATTGNGTAANHATTSDYTYNGESIATIAGIADQDLVCDDFDQTTQMPSGEIDFSVATLSNLTTAMFSGGFVTGLTNETSPLTQVQAYDTAAVLVANLENLGAENSGDAQQVADYNYALWNLMEPGKTNDGIADAPLDTNAANDLQTAFNAATAATPTAATNTAEADLAIYTPTSAYAGNQEFLGLSTSTTQTGNQVATPEPSSWILMAVFGLFLCIPRLRSRLSAAVSRG